MDPDHALDGRARENRVWELVNDIIFDMENRFIMASQWSDFLARLHIFFKAERSKWRKAIGKSPESTNSDSGGGLKEYADLFERPQKEFGTLENKWSRTTTRDDLKLEHGQEPDDRDGSSSSTVYKHEHTPVSTPTQGFTAVNREPITASEAPSQLPYNNVSSHNVSSHNTYSDSSRISAHHRLPYSPHGVQSKPPAAPGDLTSHSAYNTGPTSYGSAQGNRDSYPVHDTVMDNNADHFWHTPQGQQLVDPNQMELAGQTGVNMLDFHHLQQGTSFVGIDSGYGDQPSWVNVPNYNYTRHHDEYLDQNYANQYAG
jgi:hypothetical protein